MTTYVKCFIERPSREPELRGVRYRADVPYWIADQCAGCRIRFTESNETIVSIKTHLGDRLFFHHHCAERAIVIQ